MTDLVRVDVLEVVGDAVTVGIPDGRGGQATVVLEPPHTSPQFTPAVGSTALLLMSGPVPKLLPESIAVDAISAREIKAGSITAEHITTGSLDGLVITGATVQTAATGARVVQDADGLRLIDVADVAVVDFSTLTGSALITGIFRTAASGLRIEIITGNDGGVTLDFYDSADTLAGRMYTEMAPGGQTLFITVGTAVLSVSPTDGVYMGAAGGASSVRAASNGVQIFGGVGFNATTPIPKQTLPAAATDLASVIALTNAIRTALINYGLCQ